MGKKYGHGLNEVRALALQHKKWLSSEAFQKTRENMYPLEENEIDKVNMILGIFRMFTETKRTQEEGSVIELNSDLDAAELETVRLIMHNAGWSLTCVQGLLRAQAFILSLEQKEKIII
ncbi:MAG: hypothetical protein ACK5MN_06345 [Lachnospiraceae bacterium]